MSTNQRVFHPRRRIQSTHGVTAHIQVAVSKTAVDERPAMGFEHVTHGVARTQRLLASLECITTHLEHVMVQWVWFTGDYRQGHGGMVMTVGSGKLMEHLVVFANAAPTCFVAHQQRRRTASHRPNMGGGISVS